MSRRVKKYKHHLKFLSVCEHKSCKRLLGNCDKELIKSICECALNVLHGSIPLQQKNKRKLAKHKNDLHNLASKVVSIQKKKQIVQKVEDSSRSCWVQSCRSLHHYFLIGNNHGPEDSVCKRNDSQDT